MYKFKIWSLFLLFPVEAWSAACCGGGSSLPSMITSDDQSVFSSSLSRASVVGADTGQDQSEITQTVQLGGATLLSDRWQAGLVIPLVFRNITRGLREDSGNGIGDLRLHTSYEILPEWTYSDWKPRGWVFLQWTLPSGKSIYHSQNSLGADTTGKGFHLATFGLFLQKTWNKWDLIVMPEVHTQFGNTFPTLSGPVSLSTTWGWSTSFGIGFSPISPLRLGLKVQPTFDRTPQASAPGGLTESADRQVWDTSLEASYLLSSEWSTTLAYVDQTLLGRAINSNVSRTISIGIQKRWSR